MRPFENITDSNLDDLLEMHYRINILIEDTFWHVKHLVTPEFREAIGNEHLITAIEDKIRNNEDL